MIPNDKPEGTQLVKDLITSDKNITIAEGYYGNGTSAEGIGSSDIDKNGNKGSGTGASIEYDAYDSQGGEDINGSNTRPPQVGLAHELLHARHMVNGERDPNPTGKNDPEVKNRPYPLTREELRTRQEENKIRKEQNTANRIVP